MATDCPNRSERLARLAGDLRAARTYAEITEVTIIQSFTGDRPSADIPWASLAELEQSTAALEAAVDRLLHHLSRDTAAIARTIATLSRDCTGLGA